MSAPMITMHHLAAVDYVVIGVYFAFVLWIGVLVKRSIRTSADFLESGRRTPAWVAGLAFLSANLGAQEVIGMGASGAKYGIATAHFYWIGAIPAMVFIAIFMMPFYYGSRARSVPEYLRLRFDEKTRTFNAVSFAVMTVFSSGVSMYAMGELLHLLLGWNLDASMLVAAGIVLVYTTLGGLTSAIYNEVLQFCLIVAGLFPLVLLGLHDIGGWHGIVTRLSFEATVRGLPAGAYTHAWKYMGSATQNPVGVEWFGLVMGLGFVLSFGYWCTDFLVVQRAMASDSMTSARRVPLIAAFPKMLFPALVILPGMIALAGTSAGTMLIPAKLDAAMRPLMDAQGRPVLDYDLATPTMLLHYLPNGLLGLGLTALLASFMSGMAGNITAFNTVWTYDIYQGHIRPHASDAHYLWVGRVATVGGTILAVMAAYVARSFNNIMDVLQLVFAFVNAPLFATFALGMFWKRTTANGAFYGLVAGTLGAAVHHGLTLPSGAVPGLKGGYLGVTYVYPSELAQTFWTAITAFVTCAIVTVVISVLTRPRAESELHGLVYSLTPRADAHDAALDWYKRPHVLAVVVLAATLVLNIIFW